MKSLINVLDVSSDTAVLYTFKWENALVQKSDGRNSNWLYTFAGVDTVLQISSRIRKLSNYLWAWSSFPLISLVLYWFEY